MHLIAYVSDYVGNDAESDVIEIVATSQKNNPLHEITGVMFHGNNRFLQFLEGDVSVVKELMRRIAADTRHTNITLLFDEPIAGRGLPDWNMDCFDSDKNLDIDFLQKIRDGYKKTFKTQTNVLVGIYKGFFS